MWFGWKLKDMVQENRNELIFVSKQLHAESLEMLLIRF